MSEGMRCQNCGREISGDEVFATEGKTLCEDCYIDAGHRICVCDPWAERSKKISVGQPRAAGDGRPGQLICKSRFMSSSGRGGRATRAERHGEVQPLPTELENEFAILRHCQLLKGRKEGDTVYTPW